MMPIADALQSAKKEREGKERYKVTRFLHFRFFGKAPQ